MNKKEKCAEVMGHYFGPVTAKLILESSDFDDIILGKCKAKLSVFFGKNKEGLLEKYVLFDDLEAKRLIFSK